MRFAILHISLWVLTLPLLAQAPLQLSKPSDFYFEQLPPGHELSKTTVLAIVEDNQGLIWMGTGSGLVKFDGYQYQWFRSNPSDSTSLCNNWVKSVLKDKTEAVLWLGTSRGFSRFDLRTETFKNYLSLPDVKGSAREVNILGLSQDANGNIWISTVESGLICFDPKTEKFTWYRHDPNNTNSLSADFIGETFHDQFGCVWINTNRGIDILDPSTMQFQRIDARKVIQDTKGNMWLFSYNLLRCFNPESKEWTTIPESEMLVPFIASMQENFIDNRNRLWIDGNNHLWSAENNALVRFDLYQRKLMVIPYMADDPESIFFGDTWCMYEDSAHSFWLGNIDGGYYRLDAHRKKFRHIPIYNINTPDKKTLGVHDMISTSKGQLWLNAGREKLILFDPVSEKTYTAKGNLQEFQRIAKQDHIWSMVEDQKGFVWMGTFWGGAYIYDPLSGNISRFRDLGSNIINNIQKAVVYATFLDRSGRIWLGYNNNKIAAYHPTKGYLVEVSALSGFPKAFGEMRQFWEDDKGMVWAGAKNGDLLQIDPHNFQVIHYYPFPAGFNRVANFDDIRTFLGESDKKIWFSTNNGGLFKIDIKGAAPTTRNWQEYNSNLPTDELYSFVQDNEGDLWIGSKSGLIRFDTKLEKVTDFFSNKELEILSLTGSSWKHQSGQLYFGTEKGLLTFHPDSIIKNTQPPVVTFTDFLLFNKSVPIAGTFLDTFDFSSPLRQHIRYTKEIELKHWQNNFSIEFTALNYSHSDKNKFSYRLEGYDENWIPASSTKRIAHYTNLDPGKYTFRVGASNNDDFWNEEGATLQIRILPPWWATWWAYTLYGILLFSIIYYIYQFQLNKKLAEAEAVRLQELDTFKTKLYTNITHEFRTPLTIILGMTDQIKNQVSEHVKENLQIIKRNGHQLLKLVNQMLDLSKLESRSLKLDYEQSEIINYLQYLMESFHSLAGSKDIRLHFMSDLKEFYMDYDPVRLMHVLSNLLSNAIKFTPEGKDVYIAVGVVNKSNNLQHLLIKVKDTGIGIPEEKLPYIFDRFYQADDSATRRGEGTGIGLTLARELVKLMDGELTVKSKLGKGSEFMISLPVTRNYPIKEKKRADYADPIIETLVDPIIVKQDSQEGKPLMLLVEDNPDLVKYLVNSFNSLYNLEIAYNGKQGIDKAIHLIPDIIITDVMMPEKDGFELCDMLKNNKLTSHIPIIMLTAKVDVESRLLGLKRGADAYLGKPFLQQELEVHINALLAQRQKLQAYYLSLAGISNNKQALIPSKEEATLENAFLKNVNEIIEANLANEQFSVEQLCQEMFIDPSNLYRKLKALTGISPNQYIRSIRLAKAKALLQTTDLSIAAIALECGFSYQNHFSRIFKEEIGLTPTQYRSGDYS